MDRAPSSLCEVINGIACDGRDGEPFAACDGCAARGGLPEAQRRQACEKIMNVFVIGADMQIESRKMTLTLAPRNLDGDCARLLGRSLERLFGLDEVELRFEAADPIITADVGGYDREPTSAAAKRNQPAAANQNRRAASRGAGASRSAGASKGAGANRPSQRERVRAGDFLRSMKGLGVSVDEYLEGNPDIICGARIEGEPTPIAALTADDNERAVIWGEIVTLECRPVKSGGKSLFECGISDGTGSMAVKMFLPDEYVKHFKNKMIERDFITVYGEIRYDSFLKEPVMYAVDISKNAQTLREDDEPVKRVELHAHTQMSAMDAVSPVGALVNRAAALGHHAMAVTDHGVVQAFPDACEAGMKNGVKIIYGVEAYLDDGIDPTRTNSMANADSQARANFTANADSQARANFTVNSDSQARANYTANADSQARANSTACVDSSVKTDSPPSADSAAKSDPPANGEHALHHVILLVKNQAGLKNLYKLISKSHINYFRRNPRMPRREIEAHREGLIVGSACEAGELYSAIIGGKRGDDLKRIASFYDYLEIQPIDNNMFLLRENKVDSAADLRAYNALIAGLGEELGKPVVATCDVHFADRADEVFRRILMAGQGYQDAENQPPLYFRTTREMLDEFAYLGSEKAYEVVVTNTNLLEKMVDDTIRPIPEGTFTPEIPGSGDELKQIIALNAKKFYGDSLAPIIKERLESELDIIISKNFSVLYMIAHKLVKKSNEDGYMVGSRGSVGASLSAMLAGITEVNPLPPHYLCRSCHYIEFSDDGAVGSGFDLPDMLCPTCGSELIPDGQDIMFEIFIGAKGSEKAPDIDLNFSGEYQVKAHKYTEELFGESNVFKAGTIGTIANKTAYGFVKKYLESKGLNPGRIEEERLTKGCTGVKRTTGQHPGGIVVIPYDKEIYDFTPVQRPADAAGTNIVTTHFDFNTLHETILKLDLLGHDDPSMIRMLEELTGVKSDTVKMNDPTILSLFTGTRALGVTPDEIGSPVGTIGLPEFGTKFIRQMLVDTKPGSFSDLLQISGLSHGTNVWLNNAQSLIKKGVCTISEVIGTRESLVLYLMKKGLDQLTAFGIMEAVRKNRGVSADNERIMKEKGVPDWYIESCKKIEYLFTKAHATAYVQMAYRQAWYKIYRPLEFYAAYFSIRADEFDASVRTRGVERAKARLAELNDMGRDANPREQKILTILEVVMEMYARGIRFLPVDIYRSDAELFLTEGGGLRPPLAALSGLGAAAAQAICSARSDKPFISIEDMVMKAKLSRSIVEILREYGALDGMARESQISLFDL